MGMFKPFIRFERRQLDVNERNGYESYAGTCFHAHQYAEKVLKDKLLEFGARNIRVHRTYSLFEDLVFLIGDDAASPRYSRLMDACHTLDRVYGSSRYPGENHYLPDDFTEGFAREICDEAYAIVGWASSLSPPRDSDGRRELKRRLTELDRARRGRAQYCECRSP